MIKPKNSTTAAATALLMVGAVTAAAHAVTPFVPGDLVVTRDAGGDLDFTTPPAPGSVAPIATGGPLAGFGVCASVFIDEYKPDGTLVQSIPLPNVQQTSTNPGVSYALTFSGTQNNEGTIELSGDNRFFTIVGYNQTAGNVGLTTTGSNAVASTTIQRVVGVISMDGSVNTTTGLQDVSSQQSPRSAWTSDGTQIWVGGSSGSNVTINGNATVTQGVHYTTIGSTTSTQITLGNTNQRIISAYDFGSGPQLLLSSNSPNTQTANATTGVLSTVFRGIATIGTGLPTTGDATPVTLNPVQFPGFSATVEPAAHETADNYWFKDKNTLYIADQRDTTKTGGAFGGVQKWTYRDTNGDGVRDSWVFAYNITMGTGVLNPDTNSQNQVGAHGLSGMIDPTTGAVDLFVTTFDGTGANSTSLYSVIDNGSAFSSSKLADSASHSAFRGVNIVPGLTGPSRLLGDANGDSKVDLTDVNIVLNNFGKPSYLFADGNFDSSDTIDLTDLADVLNNLTPTGGAGASASIAATPEPASLALLGLGVAGVLMRRRRA